MNLKDNIGIIWLLHLLLKFNISILLNPTGGHTLHKRDLLRNHLQPLDPNR